MFQALRGMRKDGVSVGESAGLRGLENRKFLIATARMEIDATGQDFDVTATHPATRHPSTLPGANGYCPPITSFKYANCMYGEEYLRSK